MNRLVKVYTSTLSCEAIFRILGNGDYIIISQCGGGKEPDIDNRIYLFRSRDKGQTWSEPVRLYEDGNAVYQTEVSVLNGKIYVFVTTHNGKFLNNRNFLLVSDDFGYTWQERELPLSFQGLVFIRGMIRCSSGRIVWPYQFYPLDKAEEARLISEGKHIWESSVTFTECGVMIGGEGEKLRLGGKVRIPHGLCNAKIWQWPEPSVVELSDNALSMMLRVNGTNYLYQAVSADGGESWSQPVRTDIYNPGNKPKLIRMNNNDICLINTPNKGKFLTDRHPLCLWLSNDDMKSWYYKAEIDDSAPCLSYPDGIAVGDSILFSYEKNRKEIWFAEHTVERRRV